MPEHKRNPLRLLLSLAQRYGDIAPYRDGSDPAYLLNHPDYVRYVLVENCANYSKATFLNRMFKSIAGDSLLTSEGTEWRSQRRLTQPAFHVHHVATLGKRITDETLAMLDGWQVRAEGCQALDVAREMSRLMLSILLKSLFGVGMIDNADSLFAAIDTGLHFLTTPDRPEFQAATGVLDEVVHAAIRERRRGDENKTDLFSMLLGGEDEETGQALNDRQLRDHVATFILAGAETTATALAWTWYLLARHPEIGLRLATELREVLRGRVATPQDIGRLKYTRMVFLEAIRLYPPAWIIGRRTLRDDTIGGRPIPANTVIALSPYLMHHQPTYWRDCDTFDPERFTPENSAGRPSFAYFPFGGGPRTCIGYNLAMTEASLIMATVAQRFSMHLVPGQSVEPEPQYVLRPRSGVLVTLHDAAAI